MNFEYKNYQISKQSQPSKHETAVDLKDLIKHLSTLFRKNNITYDQSKYLFREVRLRNKLKPSNKPSVVKNPLTPVEMIELWETAYRKNTEHGLIIETLYFTGARNNEFCHMEVKDFFPDENKIFIRKGKGDKQHICKQRFVPIPQFLSHKLRIHIGKNNRTYLFETIRYDKYSTRRINEIVKQYGAESGIPKHIHPHLLRHSIATYLREKGWATDRIAVFLGHTDSGVTERVYAKVGFPTINREYQQLVSGSYQQNDNVLHLQKSYSTELPNFPT